MATAAKPAFAWADMHVPVINGLADKRIETGEEFATRPLGSFWSLEPTSKPKHQGLAFIPSLYSEYDAREHAAQREHGQFVALVGDIDKGNHSIERVEALVQSVAPNCAYLIHSTANAIADDMRWRIILPLGAPVDFPIWRDAQEALFNVAGAAGMVMDGVTERAGQISFLPNVPPVHDKTGQALRDGEGPLYYSAKASDLTAPGLDITHGSIAEAVVALRLRRAEDERLRDQMRAEAERRRASQAPSSEGSVIEAFNRSTSIADLLSSYGYEQSRRNPADWRSPLQTSGSFATRMMGDKWVSLSGSDAAAGIGARCASGCYGDAFDLFVHWEHGGDRKTAWKQVCQEQGRDRNVVPFTGSMPPPRQMGDPGPTLDDYDGLEPGESVHLRPGFNPITGDTIEAPEDPGVLPLADLDAWATGEPSPKPFVLAGRIPKDEITLLTGDGGTNKSTFGQQLATCRAAAKPLLGIDLEPGATIYLTAEDDFDRLEWTHKHHCEATGVPRTGLAGKLYLSSVRGVPNNELATFDNENRIRPTAAFRRLKATLIATKADMLVLDNVAHLFAGNENDRAQVTAFVNLLYSLCRELGVTILLIAHKNKTGDSYSGSTAWLNAVRSQLVIERTDSDDPDERVLKVGKANYARPDEILHFRWHNFALVRDEDLPSDMRAELDAVIRSNGERAAFLRCLAKATEDRRAVSHNKGSNYYANIFAAMPEGKGLAAKGFERAFESLLHLGDIKLDQPLWQDAHRHWKQGIMRAEKCGNPPAATPCGDLRRPPAQTLENTAAPLRAAPPPSTTYYPGAAQGSAAPVGEEDEDDIGPDFLAPWDTASEAGR